MMDKAIGDKASLVDVENDLIAKMEDCISQLGAELEESNARFAKMKGVREVREGMGRRMDSRILSLPPFLNQPHSPCNRTRH